MSEKKKKKNFREMLNDALTNGVEIDTKLMVIPLKLKIEDIDETTKKPITRIMNMRLVEMTGPLRAEWGKYTRENTDTEGLVTNFENYQQTLIQKCLHDENGSRVDIAMIDKLFPGTEIVNTYNYCLMINELIDLDAEEEDPVKKD